MQYKSRSVALFCLDNRMGEFTCKCDCRVASANKKLLSRIFSTSLEATNSTSKKLAKERK